MKELIGSRKKCTGQDDKSSRNYTYLTKFVEVLQLVVKNYRKNQQKFSFLVERKIFQRHLRYRQPTVLPKPLHGDVYEQYTRQ